MSDLVGSMVQRGIHTTSADYWIHFHPLEMMAYWYSVELAREFISANNLPIYVGKSKVGASQSWNFSDAPPSYQTLSWKRLLIQPKYFITQSP